MISRAAYDLASVLVTGGCSLHDLRSSMIHAESIDHSVVDEYVRTGLRELVALGWLKWTYEPDYGTDKSEKPGMFDLPRFDFDWKRCLVAGELREVTPDADNPTLFLDVTDGLIRELGRPDYSQYD